MVEAIQCYKDSTGKIHESAHEAHVADLVAWINKFDGINEASARQLVDYLTTTHEMCDTTLRMFVQINETRPQLDPLPNIGRPLPAAARVLAADLV